MGCVSWLFVYSGICKAITLYQTEGLQNMDIKLEVINEDEMEFVSRGRKSNVPQALVDAISKLAKGKVARITSLKVDNTSKTAKTDKARVSAVIRQAGKQAGKAVRIAWSQDGTPQVLVK